METVNLSQVGQTSFTNKQEVQKEATKTPEQKKNGKKLLALGAAAVGAIAIAGLAIKKGKMPKATQVADLKFNKGIATKGDELFTGIAEHTNKKGDKFLLEYKDGQLLKSSKNINPKTGAGSLEKGNFVKTYSGTNGTRKVNITEETIDGVQRRSCEVNKNKVTKAKSNGEIDTFEFVDSKISKQNLSDGTERYYTNGQIRSEGLPDSTARHWYNNGQMKSEKLPDGTNRYWYDNGQMKSEKLPDGTNRYWHDNGQIEFEELPDGISKLWNENGQIIKIDAMLSSEDIGYSPMFIRVNFDEATGKIKSIKHYFNTDPNRCYTDLNLHDTAHTDNDGRLVCKRILKEETMKKIFDKLNIEMPEIVYE